MLGDKAYKASKNVLAGWVQPAANSNRPPFTREKLNKILNGVRQRVSSYSNVLLCSLMCVVRTLCNSLQLYLTYHLLITLA
jgi:hypothetical protein